MIRMIKLAAAAACAGLAMTTVAAAEPISSALALWAFANTAIGSIMSVSALVTTLNVALYAVTAASGEGTLLLSRKRDHDGE